MTNIRRLACIICLSAVILLIAFAQISEVAHAESSQLSPEGQQILSLLNDQRAAAGLGLLTSHSLLNQAAQAHSDDILINHNYSHWGTDGTLVANRVARTGYSDTPWVSENWVTSRSPHAAMQWWMNDYVHRINILTPRWAEVGVGVSINHDSGEMVFVTVFSPGSDAKGEYVSGSVGTVASAASVVNVPAEGLNYAVQAGDTLLAIGLRHGMDFENIAAANGLNELSLLQIGQVLHIPGNPDAIVQSVEVGLGVGGPEQIETVDYHISAGDTLVSIAMKTNSTWRELAVINGLGEFSLLQIDDVIQVPAPPKSDDEIAEPVAASEHEVAVDLVGNNETARTAGLQGGESSADSTRRQHIVKPGDTLIGIAVKYDVDLTRLMLMNSLSESSLLQLGQKILLP